MRLNLFIAQATDLSRRAADQAIREGRVAVNHRTAELGTDVGFTDKVTLDGRIIVPSFKTQTIIINKPAGFVVSKQGQGSKTIYDFLPTKYHSLNPVGRLDKDSGGLLVLTNNGSLANQLTHPRYGKTKVYEIKLDKPLHPLHHQIINDQGIMLEDGLSQLKLTKINEASTRWQVTMTEGRNRQIRRTFASLGYLVIELNRVQFGPYSLNDLKPGDYAEV